MKDFKIFKASISDDVLTKWDKEIRSTLIPKIDKELKDDPIGWQTALTQSYAFNMSMRLLEAYHAWLNE